MHRSFVHRARPAAAALAVAMLFAGCGSSSDGGDAATTSTAERPSTTTEAPTTTTTLAPLTDADLAAVTLTPDLLSGTWSAPTPIENTTRDDVLCGQGSFGTRATGMTGFAGVAINLEPVNPEVTDGVSQKLYGFEDADAAEAAVEAQRAAIDACPSYDDSNFFSDGSTQTVIITIEVVDPEPLGVDLAYRTTFKAAEEDPELPPFGHALTTFTASGRVVNVMAVEIYGANQARPEYHEPEAYAESIAAANERVAEL